MTDDPNLIGFTICIHRIGFIRNFRAVADLISTQSAAWTVSTRTGHNVLAATTPAAAEAHSNGATHQATVLSICIVS